MLLKHPLSLVATLLFLTFSTVWAAPFVWIEAENPKETNFPPAAMDHWANKNPKQSAVFSGGKWICWEGNRPPGVTAFLVYEFDAPEAGKYTFFARKFWHHGPFKYQVNGGAWSGPLEGKEEVLLDSVELQTHWSVSWVNEGPVDLKAGKNTLRIEVTKDTSPASFDAFIFTQGRFKIRGKLKPSDPDPVVQVAEGWFPFQPKDDEFTNSPLDVAKVTGRKPIDEAGRIKVKGEDFVLDKSGNVIRFFATNTGSGTVMSSDEDLTNMAKLLAKRGINMIRWHGGIWGDAPAYDANPKMIDRMQKAVTIFKKEGIYSTLSIYFPLWMQIPSGHAKFGGYPGNKNPFAVLFFNKDFQDMYYGWWKAVLTTPNPHSTNHQPLGKDPAVAVIELVNEDGNLFYTFNYDNIPGPMAEIIEKQFGDWVTKKYGSIDKGLATWNKEAHQRDNTAEGRLGFLAMWNIANQKTPRGQDTATFLAENQKLFFEQAIKKIKGEFAYEGLIYASNWITASSSILGPLDKWSNTVADLMDRHAYWGPKHEGDGSGFSVRKGHTFENGSALLFDPVDKNGKRSYSLPFMDIRYNNLPSICTEVNWTPPNPYRADFPLVMTAYQLLQGSDGFYNFAQGLSWEDKMGGGFPILTPDIAVQWPAASIIYHLGLIKRGQEVVSLNLALEDIKKLKGVALPIAENLDQLRQADVPAGKAAAGGETKISPLAYLVGSFSVTFSEKGGPSKIADMSKYIDTQNKIVTSSTGELVWDYNVGLLKVKAPAAQALTGFLSKAGKTDLGDVVVDSKNDYGAVTVVALDGKPIAQSSSLLLQVTTEYASQNYETSSPDGLRTITNMGESPLIVKKINGTVSLKRADAGSFKVTALDENLYPRKDVTIASGATIQLDPTTFYYHLTK